MIGPKTTAPGSSTQPQLSGPDAGPRVVLGGLQRVGGFLLINLITAAAAVLLLRYLGVRDFGRYGTVIALMTIVQGVSDGGLSLTGSRELALCDSETERRDLLGHLIGLRILLTGVSVVLAIGFAVAVGYGRALAEGAALVGVSVFLLSVQSAMLLPLGVELDNSRLAANDVLRQVVLVSVFVILVATGASLLGFFAASPAAALVVFAGTPLLLRSRRLTRPRWSPPALRSLAARTLPLALFGVLSVLYFRVLVILMSLAQSSALALGDYVTSARVIEILLGIPVVLIGVVLPVLSVSARDDTARLQYVTLRLTQTMAWLGTLFALLLVTGARPIILALGGEQYRGAISILQIQALALVTIFVTAAWTTTLVGMGRTRELAISTVVGLGAVLGAGTGLIIADGARGAAIAAVLADLVYCATVFGFARRAGATRALHPRPFVTIAAAAAPGALLAQLGVLPATANCVVAIAVFVVLSLRLGGLPPEIVERGRSGIRVVWSRSSAP